jgi:hypothetical protein
LRNVLPYWKPPSERRSDKTVPYVNINSTLFVRTKMVDVLKASSLSLLY